MNLNKFFKSLIKLALISVIVLCVVCYLFPPDKNFDPLYGELVKASFEIARPVNETKLQAALEKGKVGLNEIADQVDPDQSKRTDIAKRVRDKVAGMAEKWGTMVGLGDALKQAVNLTDEDCTRLGREFILRCDAKNRILAPEDPRSLMVSEMVSPYREIFGGKAGRKLSVKIYDNSTVNAFACSDGSIRIHRGLIDRLSPRQLWGVIGHEIGHVVHDHTQDKMRHAILVAAGGEALLRKLSPNSGQFTFKNFAEGLLIRVEKEYLSASFSRACESQADDYSVDFLYRYGRDPYAVAALFRKLEANQPSTSGWLSEFDSHPSHLDRAKRAEKRAREIELAANPG